MFHEQTITNSSRGTLRECPYKYYCEYVLGLSPKDEPVYFQWGSLVHTWADGKAQNLKPEEIQALVYQEVEKRAPLCSPSIIERLEAQICILPAVFEAHERVWGETDKRFEIVKAEMTFDWNLPDAPGWRHKGKIDEMRKDLDTGRLYQWERKTYAKTGPSFWRNVILDTQPRNYLLGAHNALGFSVFDVVYDIFKKPGLMPRVGEDVLNYHARLATAYRTKPREYMERGPVNGMIQVISYTERDLEEYYGDLIMTAKELEWRLDSGIWQTQHSLGRKGGCTYYPLCKAALTHGEGSDEWYQALNEHFIMRSAFHPELVEDKALLTSESESED